MTAYNPFHLALDTEGYCLDPTTGKRICGATKRRSEGPCRRSPAVGRLRCMKQGRAVPRGIASPHYKNGRYSRDLPTRLLSRYHELTSDPDHASLVDEMALVRLRLGELVRCLDASGTDAVWKELQNEWDKLCKTDDAELRAKRTEVVGHLITRGSSSVEGWEEIGSQIDRSARVAEKEQKRLAALGQSIPVEQLLLLAGAMVEVISEEVSDRAVLNRIAARLGGLLSLRGGQPAERIVDSTGTLVGE